METDDLNQMAVADLLRLFSRVLDELRSRGVVRSTNNPVADYAEYLVIKALDLRAAPKSTKGYDAVDAEERKYEVKARRLTENNKSRMLSAIRDLEDRHFDFLAGVLFNEDFSFNKACLIPFGVVKTEAVYRKHVNAHILMLRDPIWEREGVVDISLAIHKVIGTQPTLKAMVAAAR